MMYGQKNIKIATTTISIAIIIIIIIIIIIDKYDQKSMQQENRQVALYTELRVF